MLRRPLPHPPAAVSFAMARKRPAPDHPTRLPAYAADGQTLHVIVDTPKGSRNKFVYDEDLRLYRLSGVLPAGAVFPFDFGYVPSTRGGDGDPLDVLVLLDEPTFVGCLVPVRLLGVVEAEQTEDGETTRNDRLVGVAASARNHADARTLADLPGNLLDEIQHFFVSYNAAKGKVFRPLGTHGPERAAKVVAVGQAAATGTGAPAGA